MRKLFSLALVAVLCVGCATAPPIDERANQELFFRAVHDGDIAQLKKAMAAGAEVDAAGPGGATALALAE